MRDSEFLLNSFDLFFQFVNALGIKIHCLIDFSLNQCQSRFNIIKFLIYAVKSLIDIFKTPGHHFGQFFIGYILIVLFRHGNKLKT